jgi:methionyl-tRNA formyltransferase
MRAVFFGSPPHAVPVLAALAAVADVALVVTVPDAAKSRSGRPVPSQVAEAALAWGMTVARPERPSEIVDDVRRVAPDVAVVTAYRGLIRPDLLGVPTRGFVNVHFSLLPRWRGASPVVRAILAGDTVTGVTLMQMDAGLDTGPVLASRRVPVGSETAGVLTARLSALGAGLLGEALPLHVAGEIEPVAQNDEEATAAGLVRVEEAFVDPARHTTAAVARAVRAFDPWPGAWAIVDGVRVKLWGTRPADPGPEAGSAVSDGERLVVGTSDGAVELLEVQPSGKRRMSGAAWARGRRGGPIRFEQPRTHREGAPGSVEGV